MIFSSLTFLAFLVVVLGLFLGLKEDRHKRLMLLAASYVFYGAWDWRFCFLILASSVWSWYWGGRIYVTESERRRRLLIVVSMCGDLGLLAYFKYANFFIESFAHLFGIQSMGALQITLPVGISFFTFQSMSYTVDLYRRRIEPCNDVLRFLLFVSFFPQLVAGPIVRASEFLPQLDRPLRTDREQISRGVQIFLLGMAQKVLVADNLATFVDPIFKSPASYSPGTLWAGIAAYSLQIFCDFSGYSLMAIGVARMFGFELPENFRTPYLSRSITEFWRRWHISLSSWLRDYLYIPLGGNRKGGVRTDVNLFLTMLLGGLWHGAGWNFVVWGGLHGAGLFVHKHFRQAFRTDRLTGRGYQALGWAATLLFCCLLWVPFRCGTFATTLTYLKGLVVDSGGMTWLHVQSMVLIGLMVLWHALWERDHILIRALPSPHPTEWGPAWTIGLLVLAIAMFAPFEASPFIYFQF